jgi:hypothetical protein
MRAKKQARKPIMKSSSFSFREITEDFRSLSVELIALEPDQVEQAHRLSQLAASEAQRWQIYLNALGLFGFEQWLTECSALSVNRQACSLFQPGYATLLPAVAQIQVGAFRICLIAVESDPEQIELPRAVVELPEFMAHFYVVAEVLEELQMVKMWGFMRHDQLSAHQLSAHQPSAEPGTMQINSDWTVTLPLSVFELETDRLLLHLRCLDPAALPLPAVNRQTQSQIQADLMPRLSSWQPTQTPLWQVLDWQQGAALFTCPELVNWLVQPRSAQWQSQSNLFQIFTQPAINVGRWLNNELDDMAQNLAWVLLPPPAPTGFRTSTDSASLIMTQLDRLGMAIPAAARSAYQDLTLAELRLRLYAVTWAQLSSEGISEWSLVIVLAAQPEHHLPLGLQLQVSDLTGVLIERTLTQFIPDAHLYACVVGSWHEKFVVTITDNATSLTLPPFAFNPA